MLGRCAALSFLLFGPRPFLSTQVRLTMLEEKSTRSVHPELTLAVSAVEVSAAGEPAFLDISGSAMNLQTACAADESFMYATYASTRTEELAVTGWNEEQKENFLRLQFEAQRRSYLVQVPDAEYFVVRCGQVAVGRLIVERTPAEIHIVDIALLPQFRQRGIGSILMRAILNEAKKAGKSVRLFVEQFNPALPWYQQLGFSVVSKGPIYLEMIWCTVSPEPREPRFPLTENVAGASCRSWSGSRCI
jgi:ribosomal protein S18 acetylase RimI-like enzyme